MTLRQFASDEHRVSIDGLDLYYRTAGPATGRAVVVLHGIMGHSREWDVLMGALAAEYRVVAVDQRGHGRSDWADDYSLDAMAGDLIELIERLGLGRPAVIGHSLGGIVGMVVAARRPDLIDRLVVVDAAPETVTGEPVIELATFMVEAAASTYSSVEDALALWSSNPLADPELLQHYVEHCLRKDDRGELRWRFDGSGLLGFLESVDAERLRDAIDRISVPVLLVRGAHSPFVSQTGAVEMVERLRQGRLHVVEGGGHDLGVERPHAVAEAALGFLAEAVAVS